MTRTKKDIAAIIAKYCNVKEYYAEGCVSEILKNVIEWIANGDNVKLRGFGTLYPKVLAPTKARIVKRGLEIEVPERIKPKFKTGKKFYERLNSK